MPVFRPSLVKSIERNSRTERYQQMLDAHIARCLPHWDPERGLSGTRGLVLPHEQMADYWERPLEEQRRLASPAAWKAYEAALGRDGVGPMAIAAFAWRSSLSRYHQDPDLLRFFQNGLRLFTDSVRSDGLMGMAAHPLGGGAERSTGKGEYTWSHGWTIGPLACGLAWCWDALDPTVRERALAQLRISGARFLKLGRNGDLGNQTIVQIYGLYAYGDLLDAPAFRRTADRYWAEVRDAVLDGSGQVIESAGPCMHYSFTAFFYVWLTEFAHRADSGRARIGKALAWFRNRYTENLTPLAGASSRKYYESLPGTILDLLPMCEQMASRNPLFQDFADRVLAHLQTRPDNPSRRQAVNAAPDLVRFVPGHGASPLIWAILASPGPRRPTAAHRTRWAAPVSEEYRRITAGGRFRGEKQYSPIRYLLVRRRYQTHFNATDYLPFCGLQTWAWGTEPPIVHPTLACPSTTRGWGLDTACQGTGRAWMDIDNPTRGGVLPEHLFQKLDSAIGLMAARFNRLYRLVVFTDAATVQLDFGRTGPRRTAWTLNRLDPAEAEIAPGVVAFAGRAGRLYAGAARLPEQVVPGPGRWTDGVRILDYDDGDGVALFAFSDDAFSFLATPGPADRTLRFADASGAYRVIIPETLPLGGEAEYAGRGLFDLARTIVVERTGPRP